MLLSSRVCRPPSRRLAGVLALPALLTGLALCVPVWAQEMNVAPAPPSAPSEKQISLDAEDATLASVITTLMQSVGANYTLDSSLRAIRVTAHLHNLRLDTALNVLLRSVTPPTTYRYENGVYSFIPKVEPTIPPLETGNGPNDTGGGSGARHIQVVRANFIDAAELARILGGIPIRTSEGQTYGLVDPNKLIGGFNSAGGTGANTPSPPPAGNNTGGNSPTGGVGGQNTTLPGNLFDYVWIINAGANP